MLSKQDSTYFPQIDVLRFFAVLLVIISHRLPEYWINQLQPGKLGVDLFFVISGFLITRILIQLKNNSFSNFQKWKIFFIRRILRIFPLYYFVVLITFIFNKGVFQEAILWNLTYCSNFYILHINQWPGIMSHFWTLSVEEHFYLFWPILILLPKKNWMLTSIGIIIFLGLFSRMLFFLFHFPFLYSYIFTTSCFDAFGIGGLLAFIHCYDNNRLFFRITRNKLLVTISIIGFGISMLGILLGGPHHNIWGEVFFRFFSGAVFFFLIGNAIHSRAGILHLAPLVFLGKLSYSMYLFHNFIPGFLMGMKYPSNVFVRFVVYYIVLIIVSYISWKLIEMPFNRLKHKFHYSD